MKWGGMTEDEAFAMVTINPAKQLRIDSRVGSLEVGKDADVVIWNHHPLSSYAIAERVYIDGTVYYDRKGEEGRLTALKKEKSSLAATEGGGTRPSTTTPQDSSRTSSEDRQGGPRADDESTQPAGTTGTAAPAARRRRPRSPPLRLPQRQSSRSPTPPSTRSRGRTSRRARSSSAAAKIEALGAGIPVPAGAQVVDAAGADVYPGFINARTQMGLNEPGARGFEDVNEMLDLNPQLRTRVAYHSESDAIAVARTNGITTVAVMPGGGTFGGEVAVMNLDGWTWEEATLKANAGITFNFPTIGGGGGAAVVAADAAAAAPEGATYEDMKRTRDRRLDELARLFDQARAYAKAGPDKTVDWTLEALVPVVERKLPLVTTVNRAQDIRDAVAFADRVKVNLVISGGMRRQPRRAAARRRRTSR